MIETIAEALNISELTTFLFILFPIAILAGRLLFRLLFRKSSQTISEHVKNSLKCILIAYAALMFFIFLAESGILENICMVAEGICLLLLPLVFLGL